MPSSQSAILVTGRARQCSSTADSHSCCDLPSGPVLANVRPTCQRWTAAPVLRDISDRVVPRSVRHRPSCHDLCHASTDLPTPTGADEDGRSEEHTSELQSLMRISYAVSCL